VAVERGPHKSTLAPDTIIMMHDKARDKVKEDFFSEVIYLDKIDHLLGTEEWSHLKIFPLAMVSHKSRKYRAILDLSFALNIFGMEIPFVNENTVVNVSQYSMPQLGSVLLRLIKWWQGPHWIMATCYSVNLAPRMDTGAWWWKGEDI